MASEIDKLCSLYIKYDTLVAAGDDVVADLRKEINNLELSVLRDSVLPKVAKLLCKETSKLRCNIDCSLQSINEKIEYSFCTDNSPLVRGALSTVEDMKTETPDLEMEIDPEVIGKLSLSLTRLSELANEIENCKTEALGYISQLQENNSKINGNNSSRSLEDIESAELRFGKILYCRSQMCDAKGRLLPNKDIIILKGSILRKDITPTYGPKAFRADILAQYCSLTDRGYIVLEDLPPMSVSGASGLCLGRSSNGNIDWKDEHNICLGDLK